ncbi:hypothetical protein [Actinoallomurus sp. NPDC050550]|uniref:hypothetical protein n=1 Tax=Actinoallomurus sp. NPDC050550 TaxID=3154937 RepID=UPI0033D44EF5
MTALEKAVLASAGDTAAPCRRKKRIRKHQDALTLVQRNPELLANAVSAGYLTYRTGDDGHPTDIKLAPDVAFSLDIASSLHDTFLLDPQDENSDTHH